MKLPRTTEDRYVVESVARALDVLEAFRDSDELTLKEISRRVGLNKSRSFRLLHTLAGRGYVEKNAGGYRLGVKLFERAAHVRQDLKLVAQPFMRQLLAQFNETVNLGVLHEGEVLYIDILESTRAFRMAATVGSRMPVLSTSLGKAIVAYLPESDDALRLGQQMGKSKGKLRSASAQALQDDLVAVRRLGYAVDDEENEPGVACVGAPLLDAGGRALAAISVSGPAARIRAQQKEIAAAVAAAGRQISQSLGFKAARARQAAGAR